MRRDNLDLLAQMGQWCIDLSKIFDENNHFFKNATQDLKKIDRQIAQAVLDLSNLKVDIVDVEKKISRIEKLEARFIQLTGEWGDLLLNDMKDQEIKISKQMQELKEVVWVDDPAIETVEKILRLPLGVNNGKLPVRSPLETNIEQLFQLCKIWKERSQVCNLFFEASDPVLSKYAKAVPIRQDAIRLIQMIDQILPENSEAWPPTSQRLGTERTTFRNRENKWEILRKERTQLRQYLDQLDLLSEQYKHLQISLSGVVEKVLQDQARFLDLERRHEESKKMWQTVSRNYQDRRGVSEGVALMLSNIEKEISQVKMQYQRGEINAQFAYQRFRGICRKTDESVVELDSGKLIDINGTIQNRL